MGVAAAANAIITWAEYKAAFGITDDTERDKYQILINQASSRIESYTDRILRSTQYAATTALILDGTGTSTLVVPHYPVTAVAHLYADSARAFAASSEIASTEYQLSSPNGIIRLYADVFPAGRGTIKLECNAGYASTSAEWQILQSACMEMVRWMVSRFAGGIGKKSETNADGMSTGYEIDIPINVRSMLDPFVRGASW